MKAFVVLSNICVLMLTNGIIFISACQTRGGTIPPKVVKVTNYAEVDVHVVGGITGNRSVRKDIEPSKMTRKESNNCSKLRPGMSSIQHATLPLIETNIFVAESKEMSMLFALNCTNQRLDFGGYIIPYPVKSVHPTTKEAIAKISLTVASFTKNEVVIKLEENISAGAGMRFLYSKLPEVYEGNEIEYFKFLNHYGTNYFKNVKLGGRLLILLTHFVTENRTVNYGLKHLDPQTNLKEIIGKLITAANLTITGTLVFHAGGSLDDTSLRGWGETVSNYPIPITGIWSPISGFFKNETSKIKKISLAKALRNENVHQELAQLIMRLKHKLKIDGKIHKQLLTLTEQQFAAVIPSEEFSHTILKLVSTENIEENFMTCHEMVKNGTVNYFQNTSTSAFSV